MILDSQDINKYLGYLNQKVYNTVTKETGLICEMRILPLDSKYSIYYQGWRNRYFIYRRYNEWKNRTIGLK